MKNIPYQVDIKIQNEIYTIPVKMVDREIAFEKTHEKIEALGLHDNYPGRSFGAWASDLKLSQVDNDLNLFKNIKSLGVQEDALYGLTELEKLINEAVKNSQYTPDYSFFN